MPTRRSFIAGSLSTTFGARLCACTLAFLLAFIGLAVALAI
jgi:hypothetical protein